MPPNDGSRRIRRHFPLPSAPAQKPYFNAANGPYIHCCSRKLPLYALFCCPANSTTRVPADFDFTTSKLTVDGKQINPLGGWVLTAAFNLMYTTPVVSVPTGLADNHVPTGMQVAARSYDDLTANRAVTRLAAEISQTQPIVRPMPRGHAVAKRAL